jgi:hypothetical protein
MRHRIIRGEFYFPPVWEIYFKETDTSSMILPKEIKKFLFLIIFPWTAMLLASCTTYYIPMESFKKQLGVMDSSALKTTRITGPFGESHIYKTDTIRFIHCFDKNDRPIVLTNSPSIEIQFTHGKKKTGFYFDRIFVTDSTVSGVQSRFMPSIQKTIELKDITKIEVRDGGKNFHQ